MKRQATKGGILLRHLPTPVYFYGLTPTQSFTMTVPTSAAHLVLKSKADAAASTEDTLRVTVTLTRVGPLKDGKRAIAWSVNGQEQVADIKDATGVFVFEGPMADAANNKQVIILSIYLSTYLPTYLSIYLSI